MDNDTDFSETSMHRIIRFAGRALSAAVMSAFAIQAWAQDLTSGGLFPQSGNNSEYGQVFSSGANLAVEHINADGKLKGKLPIVY